jgi:hypothetical protein
MSDQIRYSAILLTRVNRGLNFVMLDYRQRSACDTGLGKPTRTMHPSRARRAYRAHAGLSAFINIMQGSTHTPNSPDKGSYPVPRSIVSAESY